VKAGFQSNFKSPANFTELHGVISHKTIFAIDRLCGLVVRVPGCRSRGPGSILGTTRFLEK
jgi:hypothetical protein